MTHNRVSFLCTVEFMFDDHVSVIELRHSGLLRHLRDLTTAQDTQKKGSICLIV